MKKLKELLVDELYIKNDNINTNSKIDFNDTTFVDSDIIIDNNSNEIIPDFVTIYIVTTPKDSVEIIKQLQNKTPGIPIVIAGECNKKITNQSLMSGIIDFISPPITFQKLNQTFKKLLNDSWNLK